MLNIYSKESLENDYQHLCFSLKKEIKICRSRFKVFFFLKYTNQTSYLKKILTEILLCVHYFEKKSS